MPSRGDGLVRFLDDGRIELDTNIVSLATITLAFCWVHLRRQFFDIAKGGSAQIASEALDRIAALYAIEKMIRGKRVLALKTWLEQQPRAGGQRRQASGKNGGTKRTINKVKPFTAAGPMRGIRLIGRGRTGWGQEQSNRGVENILRRKAILARAKWGQNKDEHTER